jgi:hypothetical protein
LVGEVQAETLETELTDLQASFLELRVQHETVLAEKTILHERLAEASDKPSFDVVTLAPRVFDNL